MSETVKPTVWIFDCESYKDYFCVTCVNESTQEVWQREIYGDVNSCKDIAEFFQSGDWFVGYNNKEFDNQLITAIIRRKDMWEANGDAVALWLSSITYDIIVNRSRKFKYNTSFPSVDLMQVIRVGTRVAALKMVGVNLKWHRIQDLPIAPNELVGDRRPLVLDYNLNDVLLTQELFRHLRDKINLRAQISHRYDIDAMSESESGIGVKVFEKMYGKLVGHYDFRDDRTPRSLITLGDIVSPKVKFETKNLNSLLDQIRESVVTLDSNTSWQVTVGTTDYEIAKGGIHSVHKGKSGIYKATEDVLIKDADVGSFYPRLMVALPAFPEHLDPRFPDLVKNVLRDRLEFKKKDPIFAGIMKIAANSVYGRFGSIFSWLFDPKAMYAVTINGQLLLLMLIERLTEEGFDVFYANTDGVTTFVPKDLLVRYQGICDQWERDSGLIISGVDAPVLEFADFDRFYLRDVNNYFVVKTNGSVKAKGDYDRKGHEDPIKGFDAPVVAHALHEYFENGTSVKETILNHEDLYDFCMTQKMGDEFVAYQKSGMDGEITPLQKTNRFIIGTTGVELFKMKEGGKQRTSFAKGELCLLANDMNALKDQYPDGVPVKRSYYILRALRELALLDGDLDRVKAIAKKKAIPGELDLFGDPILQLNDPATDL